MNKRIAAALLAGGLVGVLALAGCSSDSADHKALMGEWQVEDTEVTVVFTEDELKMVGETFGYTLDEDEGVIDYTSEDEAYGTAEYTFSDDNQTLELVEDDGSGGTTTTTFVKLSDDTDAEPSAGDSDSEDSDSEDEDSEDSEDEDSGDSGDSGDSEDSADEE